MKLLISIPPPGLKYAQKFRSYSQFYLTSLCGFVLYEGTRWALTQMTLSLACGFKNCAQGFLHTRHVLCPFELFPKMIYLFL